MSYKFIVVGSAVCGIWLLGLGGCDRGDTEATAQSPDERAATQKTAEEKTDEPRGSRETASEPSAGSSSEKPAQTSAECELAVEGMVCEGCAKNIQQTVGAKSGVGSVEASHEDKSATISHDPEAISCEEIAEIVDGIERPDLKAELAESSNH